MNQLVRRSLAVVATVAISGLGVLVPAIPSAQAAGADGGTTYYVNAISGNDDAAGTSADAPWKSLDKVDATTFQPGDEILFADGDSWTGQLWPKGSGTDGNDITVGSYGTGALPQIQGAGTVADAVKLWNQQHWEITDLDIAGQATLWQEVNRASAALHATAPCDKLNLGALGNIVRQLHVHLVARRVGDAAWPGPVWGHGHAQPYANADLPGRLDALRRALAATLP